MSVRERRPYLSIYQDHLDEMMEDAIESLRKELGMLDDESDCVLPKPVINWLIDDLEQP